MKTMIDFRIKCLHLLAQVGGKYTAAVVTCLLVSLGPVAGQEQWWSQDWGGRIKITLTAGDAAGSDGAQEDAALVLLRLHAGNFPFASVRDDGGDIRIVAADQETVLPYHIERYDGLMQESFIWVRVPDLLAEEAVPLWIYYANPAASREEDPLQTYGEETVLVYHFTERGSVPPADASGKGNHAADPAVMIDGALIGGGMHLNGSALVRIPASPSLQWAADDSVTWSGWIKLREEGPQAVLFSSEDTDGGQLQIGVDGSTPYLVLIDATGQRQQLAGGSVTAGSWHHLAVTIDAGQAALYLDGELQAEEGVAFSGLSGGFVLGGDSARPGAGFNGEIDNLKLVKGVRAAGYLQFMTASQSGAADMVAVSTPELLGGAGATGGMSEALEHVMLFGDIANNMMFDGWIAVGVCIVMIIIGWSVAWKKFSYINQIQKGTDLFIQKWKMVSPDLSVIDPTDADSVRTFGGTLDEEESRLVQQTPLYALYTNGVEEVRHRLQSSKGFAGLTVRSIQVIKSSLDGVLSRELQRINKGLVYLTISIAGGPYVGLLGTVVGVMITFALIAKTGEVEVNAIAPGIASALLATVAGLIVAIPALFMYSYLNSRIKNTLSSMKVFIDEFTARMAEVYPVEEQDLTKKKES